MDNQCIESELNECFTDEECDDSNDCSFDSCKGLPRKCSYDVIDYCNDYDTCCPEICMYENDTDCPREKTMYECFSWRDCKKEGQSPCNSSACESGVCVYELQQGCSFNNTCMEINSTAVINGTESTCKQDGWLSQSGKTIGKEGTKEKGLKKYIWLFIVATVLLVTIVIISIYYKLSSKS